MRAALLLLICCVASADTGGGLTISVDEQAAVVRKLTDLQGQVDALERKLRDVREKQGCV